MGAYTSVLTTPFVGIYIEKNNMNLVLLTKYM